MAVVVYFLPECVGQHPILNSLHLHAFIYIPNVLILERKYG